MGAATAAAADGYDAHARDDAATGHARRYARNDDGTRPSRTWDDDGAYAGQRWWPARAAADDDDANDDGSRRTGRHDAGSRNAAQPDDAAGYAGPAWSDDAAADAEQRPWLISWSEK